MWTASENEAQHGAMTAGKMVIVIGYGVLLWGFGVVLLRLAAAAGWLTGPMHFVLYALIAVGTWPFIRFAPAITGLPRTETLRITAIALTTALVIDGIVIGFAPWIYASDTLAGRSSAGALLWGAAAALLLGLMLQPRRA